MEQEHKNIKPLLLAAIAAVTVIAVLLVFFFSGRKTKASQTIVLPDPPAQEETAQEEPEQTVYGTPVSDLCEQELWKLEKNGLAGRVAVAQKAETAMLLARRETTENTAVQPPESFTKLPLHQFPIEPDTLNVFADLGVRTVEDLLRIPHEDLIGR